MMTAPTSAPCAQARWNVSFSSFGVGQWGMPCTGSTSGCNQRGLHPVSTQALKALMWLLRAMMML
jgi:hypothetical protein